MANGTACSRRLLVSLMMHCRRSCASALRCGLKMKTHAAARHAAEHPKAPEIRAELLAHAFDQSLGIEVAGPGNDGLYGPERNCAAVQPPIARTSPSSRCASISSSSAMAWRAPLPLGLGAQQIFLRDHLENRADILRHAAMYQDEALLQLLASLGGDLPLAEYLVIGSRRPRLMPNSGSPSARAHRDELDAGPHTAGILPTTAGAAQPFAENGARRHQAAVLLFEAAGQRVGSGPSRACRAE